MKKVHSFRFDTDTTNKLETIKRVWHTNTTNAIILSINQLYELSKEDDDGHAETQHQQAP